MNDDWDHDDDRGDYGDDDEDDDRRDYGDYGDDDGGDSDDDGGDSDDQWKGDLRDEFRDRDRAGGQVIGCWVTGVDGQALKTQTPLGRFCLRVDAISRNINEACAGFSIPDEEIQVLLNKSQNLPRVEFKNPTAFVLGYLATRKGAIGITKTSLKNVWRCYGSVGGINKDSSIREPDIIRYARLWVK